MGKLTNLNPPKALTESDLPGTMSTDAEVTAAIAAHVAATDPHLQNPTQARGDARYIANEQGLILKLKKFTGTTNPTTGNANFLHGLNATSILQVSCIIGIDGFPPAYMAATFGGSAEYNIFFTATYFFIVCGPINNNFKYQPYKVVITYEA